MALKIVLPPLLFLSTLSVADELRQNGEACDCFLTNGSSSSYFSYHRFHDFRNVVDLDLTVIPKVVESYDSDTNLVPTSDFFGKSSAWKGDWEIQMWNNSDQLTPLNAATGGPTVLMRNSANNVYIEPSNDSNSNYSTFLTLRTTRLDDFQSVAEVDSARGNFFHLSARFLARITGSPGACAGMFTYLSNSNPQKVQEIDMEILTRDPRSRIQYTNQPDNNSKGQAVLGATTNSTIPNDIDWTQWNVYRLDWGSKATTFYVNGVEVSRIEKNVPKGGSQLIFNLWGNGGEWTGNMSVGDEAFLHIQWIEIAFNTSGEFAGRMRRSKRSLDLGWVGRDGGNADGHLLRKRGHKGCAIVCGIDDVSNVGTPVLLYNNSSPAPKTFAVMPMVGSMASLSWAAFAIITGALGLLVL